MSITMRQTPFSLRLDAMRILESEEKEGGTQTREQWSPLLVSVSQINDPREERDRVSRVKWRCSLRSAT
jgi:hypothetical protein